MTFKGIDYKTFLRSIPVPIVFFPALDCEVYPCGRRVYLRHDIDMRMDLSVEMSKIEADMGIRSTYFILNTAKYFKDDLQKDIDAIRSGGHEIGWHNDAVQAWYLDGQTKPLHCYIEEPLKILRERYGLTVRGTSAHGVSAPNEQLFRNYNAFNIKYRHISQIPLEIFSLSHFGLEYECSKIRHDLYLADSGGQWFNNPVEAVKVLNRSDEFTLHMNLHPQWWSL